MALPVKAVLVGGGGVTGGGVGSVGVVGVDGVEGTVPPEPQPVSDNEIMPTAIAVRERKRQRCATDFTGSKNSKG
jgi:hypothetical protein